MQLLILLTVVHSKGFPVFPGFEATISNHASIPVGVILDVSGNSDDQRCILERVAAFRRQRAGTRPVAPARISDQFMTVAECIGDLAPMQNHQFRPQN